MERYRVKGHGPPSYSQVQPSALRSTLFEWPSLQHERSLERVGIFQPCRASCQIPGLPPCSCSAVLHGPTSTAWPLLQFASALHFSGTVAPDLQLLPGAAASVLSRSRVPTRSLAQVGTEEGRPEPGVLPNTRRLHVEFVTTQSREASWVSWQIRGFHAPLSLRRHYKPSLHIPLLRPLHSARRDQTGPVSPRHLPRNTPQAWSCTPGMC
mmetsp:Transcript_9742/g.23314  ORF Transcript_9742/g.23314 Transcript_9742/m.23314 type:complete len:210 (-) Transcript_9742:687-1316(-)